jgi:hypothetical protein
MLKARTANHDSNVSGSLGVSINMEKMKANNPTKPSCKTPREMGLACLVIAPVTRI